MTDQNQPTPVDAAVDDEAMFAEAAALAYGTAKTAVDDAGGEADTTPEETPDDTPEGDDKENLQDDALAAEREARKKAELDREAAIGRVAPLQRELDRMKREIERLTAAQQPQKISTGDLEKAAEEYPEIAGPVMGAVKGLQEQVERMGQERALRAQYAQREAELALERAEPGWQDFINRHGDAFRDWVDDQPRRIRDAAERNAFAVVDAEEAASVIRAFRQHVEGPKPEPDAKRQRQLSAMTTPRSTRPASSVIPEEGDPEKLFAAMAKIAWQS
jgi:hypothetical protein